MASSSSVPPSGANAPGWDPSKTPYPKVHRSDVTSIYKSKEHGEVEVADPYRYLEIPPSQSDETKKFCEEQAELTQQYVDQCKDLKEMRHMLDTIVNYPRYGSVKSDGTYDDPKFYYPLNSGLDPQSTWYSATREELLKAEQEDYATPAGQEFFNENLMSKEGTTAIGNFYFSPSGQTAAYTVSHAGSDWYTVYFRDAKKPFVQPIDDAQEASKGGPDRLPDELKHVKFSSVQWTKDNKGVFYQRYTTTTKHHDQGTETDVAKDPELFYHRLGTTQEEDICVISKDLSIASNIWGSYTTLDGKWLVVYSFKGTEQKGRVYIASLDQPISSDMAWISIAPKFEYYLSYVTNEGSDFYWMTNKEAPNWKVVRMRIDPSKARKVKHVTELQDETPTEDVIAEDKDATLDDVRVVDHDKLFAVYIKDVKHQLFQFELKTGAKVERLLPDLLGTISAISTRLYDNEAFVSVMSFTTPSLAYRLSWSDGGKDPRALPTVQQHRTTKVKGMDLSAFETRQVFVPSKDGVKVPVYLTSLKGTPMDGTAPAYVYFYGGFAHSLMPTYSPRLLSWVGSYGGTLVWVNARGGSEYGERWHNGGNFLNKMNTFYDVLGACQYLVDEKIAARGKIIINGGSNGGLGVLAVANLAPEGLIGAVLSEVPVADILRFHRFTAGVFWKQEYGDPDDPEYFDYLHSYSPLHNVDANKTYPMMLLHTCDHDDRVSPLHSFKMISELQHKRPNNANPLLLRVTANAGHGASTSLTKVLEETTIKFCSSAHALGLKRRPLPGSIPMSKQ